jgi:peptidoglycan/xylan/chitin deacetylase (PgdA/CDA1 family)
MSCCSKYGYCGISQDYCGRGCQESYGRCGELDLKFNYYSKCQKQGQWALTFDDGPYIYDLDLLDYLKERNVKATFFVNGDTHMKILSSEGKKIIKRIYDDGHVIGSHTWSHINLKESSEEDIRKDMIKLEEAIESIIHKKPAFMRPPFGSGDESITLAKILGDLGYTAGCIWNVDTEDWKYGGNIDYALSVFKEYNGEPIMSLNHCYYENDSEEHQITKEKLISLIKAEIDYMLENGYTPVTMDECLGLEPYQN